MLCHSPFRLSLFRKLNKIFSPLLAQSIHFIIILCHNFHFSFSIYSEALQHSLLPFSLFSYCLYNSFPSYHYFPVFLEEVSLQVLLLHCTPSVCEEDKQCRANQPVRTQTWYGCFSLLSPDVDLSNVEKQTFAGKGAAMNAVSNALRNRISGFQWGLIILFPFVQLRIWTRYGFRNIITRLTPLTRSLSSSETFVRLQCTPGTVEQWPQVISRIHFSVFCSCWTLSRHTIPGSIQWSCGASFLALKFRFMWIPKAGYITGGRTDYRSLSSNSQCWFRRHFSAWIGFYTTKLTIANL